MLKRAGVFKALLIMVLFASVGFAVGGAMLQRPSAGAATPAAEPEVRPPVVVAPSPEPEPLPEPVPAPSPRTHHGVPLLMYHEVGDGPNSLYVREAELKAQVAELAAQGYKTVSLDQVERHFKSGEPLPEKPIVLTFDDGYASTFSRAAPILAAHGFTGTVFVITDFVGQPGYLTWDQVRQLAAAGWEVGSHTVSHPDLTKLSSKLLERQLTVSKTVLEEQLQRPVRAFCYPSGRQNAAVAAAVARAGYEVAVTTESGPATSQQSALLWRRLRVNRGESAQALARRVALSLTKP